MNCIKNKLLNCGGKKGKQAGFTLIELLIVITIIAALAVTVFVALNPSKRLEDSRDARRTSDVDTILTAIHAAIVDSGGTMPSSMGSLTAGQDYQIGTATAGNCTPALTAGGCTTNAANACVDLGTDLTDYLASIPLDASGGTAAETGYVVNVSASNIVTIKACNAEGGTNISASR